MYQYQEDRTPEQNKAMALYAIANELANLGLKDAAERRGAIELLAEEVGGLRAALIEISEAIGVGREGGGNG